jgi:hypothetical protein
MDDHELETEILLAGAQAALAGIYDRVTSQEGSPPCSHGRADCPLCLARAVDAAHSALSCLDVEILPPQYQDEHAALEQRGYRLMYVAAVTFAQQTLTSHGEQFT